ncbi:hypothetical protein GCM10020331_040170 [Ectobacillus funiculus]
MSIFLQERPYYERELSYVVTHGQVEGALANELADYSEMVVEKLEARVSKLVLIMQPLLFFCDRPDCCLDVFSYFYSLCFKR